MIDRKKASELIQSFDISKSTVAICAGVDSSQVTNYSKGLRVSSNVEITVGRAVEDIVAVIEKAKPIIPNLSDGQHLKDLIRKWREEGCFVVMINGTPAQYFASRKERLLMTRFLLQATPLTSELSEVVAEKLRADGYKAIAIENPYGVIDSRQDDLTAVWHESAVTA